MRLKVDSLARGFYTDTVILVDVLRATTVAPILLGARPQLFITPSVRAARAYAGAHDLLLAGERDGLPPQGFNHSASPAELRSAHFERDLVLTTENGPRALAALTEHHIPKHVLLGSFYNARAVTEAAARLATEEIAVVCAGHYGPEGTHTEAIEDVVCAGFLTRRLEKLRPDAARESLTLAQALLRAYADPQEALAQSESGQLLMRLGLHEDLAVASLISQSGVVPYLTGVQPIEGQPVFAFEALK